MWFGVVTLFPEMFRSLTERGVIARAIQSEHISLTCWNPCDYAEKRTHRVDDRPYGGGPGMVLQVAPLKAAIDAAKNAASPNQTKVIYVSPQGRRLEQHLLDRIASCDHLVFVSGRYEGIDERAVTLCVDEEWSIGDYVLSGGELAVMVMIDAISRRIPGVLGDEESKNQESFVEGLLDYPHYTRPERVEGLSVPKVLLSGNHEAIRRWRLKEQLGRTWLRRPDLLGQVEWNKEREALLTEFIEVYEQTKGEL